MSKRWSKRLENLDVLYRALLEKTVPLLREALTEWDGTQEEFAKSIGESRTNISHLVNCLSPETRNPEFKPLHTVKRIQLKLVALGDTMSSLESGARVAVRGPVESSNASFNRILGGMRNFIKDEVRAAVKEEIEKAKREAAARKAHLSQRQTHHPVYPPVTDEVGTAWVSRDKRRKGTVTVVTTKLDEDRIIVRTPTGRMAQGSLKKFFKRHKRVV